MIRSWDCLPRYGQRTVRSPERLPAGSNAAQSISTTGYYVEFDPPTVIRPEKQRSGAPDIMAGYGQIENFIKRGESNELVFGSIEKVRRIHRESKTQRVMDVCSVQSVFCPV